ncbi:hypothetical protein B0J14DRAFT_654600 [Halenospora varia]|nr:hypothetical protein B0J14DRAFT_654600 [Halenospora varia]
MGNQDSLSIVSNKRKTSASDQEFGDDYKRRKFTDYDDRLQLECCSKCQAMTGIFEGLKALLDTDGGGYEHYNWQEIHDSKSKGCVLCESICYISQDGWDEEYDGVVNKEIIRVYAMTKDAAEKCAFHPLAEGLYFRIPSDPALVGPMVSKTLNLVAFNGDLVSTFIPGRRVIKEFDHSVVKRARDWLDDCQDRHEGCPRRCTPLLPTRVIDVGDSEHAPIKLHISESEERSQEYAR